MLVPEFTSRTSNSDFFECCDSAHLLITQFQATTKTFFQHFEPLIKDQSFEEKKMPTQADQKMTWIGNID